MMLIDHLCVILKGGSYIQNDVKKHEAQRQERIAQAIEERRQDEIKRELKQKQQRMNATNGKLNDHSELK